MPQLDTTRLARLVETSRILNSTIDLDDLLKVIINEAAALTNAEAASILLLDPHTRQLHFRATSGGTAPGIAGLIVPLDNSIAGSVLRSDSPLIVDDVTKDERWNPDVAQTIKFRTGSILGVPMHDVDRPVGVLEAINKRGGRFDQLDVETLVILADLAGVAVEKARLIEQLRSANKQLSELDRLKSDFIAIASHELRTPLSIILGYVSFLRDGAAPQLAAQLNSVMEAAVRLRDLIQGMLNLRYVDAGQAQLSLSEVDLVTLVREWMAARDTTAEAKQQTIRFHLPPAPLAVMADRGMMEVVLHNLVNNAIKFTPEGGRIDVGVERHGAEAWLIVRDTGVGIAKDEWERIFGRFYQVEPHLRRHHEGIGLGLSIAKELVELHQGRIWVRSQLEKGSQFFVALPLKQ
ncbi:MAG: GAF domain-containing sensor histidine kinase [Chloroflexota bacterium]